MIDPLIIHLRDARLDAGMTQSDLAAAAGVTSSYLSEVESGKRGCPRPATLRRLAQPLGLQPALVPLTYETAPVEACTPVAPASDPAPVASGDRADVARCERCPKPKVGPCCSSHHKELCHECYRRTHFVEVCVASCSDCAAEGLPVRLRPKKATGVARTLDVAEATADKNRDAMGATS